MQGVGGVVVQGACAGEPEPRSKGGGKPGVGSSREAGEESMGNRISKVLGTGRNRKILQGTGSGKFRTPPSCSPSSLKGKW